VDDLNLLQGELALASNKIYLLYADTKWRPDFYFVADYAVLDNCRSDILSLEENKILPGDFRNILYDKRATYYKQLSFPETEASYGFSNDMLDGFYSGTTVTYRMLQFAVYLGCNPIYILGMDYSFKIPKNTIESNIDGVKDDLLVNDAEVNHFHPDYRKPGEVWTMPRLDVQHKAFLAAKDYADRSGIDIINISRTTNLDVFKRERFEKIIHD
jgi:hypothetical protein